MWSLPNIVEMNERKVKEFQDRKSKEILECHDCGKSQSDVAESNSQDKKQTGKFQSFEYFDIFSDTPCYNDYCQECYKKFEDYDKEGYFYCIECGKYYVSNITWEKYSVETDDGLICLNCNTRKAFSSPVGFEVIKSLDFEAFRKASHVIGVGNVKMEQEVKNMGWNDIGSITADSMTGGLVMSFHDSSTQDDTMKAFKELVKKNGYKEFVYAITGAYQFAVQISLFAR